MSVSFSKRALCAHPFVLTVLFKEFASIVAIADQYHLAVRLERRGDVRRLRRSAGTTNRKHMTTGSLPELAFGDRLAGDRYRHANRERLEPFRQKQVAPTQRVKNGVGLHRHIRQHDVRAGLIPRAGVSLERGAAEDWHVKPNTAAMERQQPIRVVTMRSDRRAGRAG